MTAPLACPQCAAALRSDAEWCPLCFTRIESGFDPLTAPIEEVLSGGGGTATLTQPVQSAPDALSGPMPQPPAQPSDEPVEQVVPQFESVGDPLAEGTEPETAESSEISDIDVMLAMLAAEHRQADPSTEILDRFGDKSTRMVIMVGGTVVIGIVCLGLLALLGTFW